MTYFEKMKRFLSSLDFKALNEKTNAHFANSAYDKAQMLKMSYQVLEMFGYDSRYFRLDESAHPFSLFLDPTDIRLTTRFAPENFSRSLLATIHEFGHGLFSSQTNRQLVDTPLWPETSYALHESQSRLWENMFGRSHGFAKYLEEALEGVVEPGSDLSAQRIWQHLNHIESEPIRVEADEITYHYHILIRFEIERAVLNGTMKVNEIEAAWNDRYQKYLGITPESAKDGFLQDIHWSFGSIGYFPTYSLGSVTSAMWLEQIKKDLPIDLNQKFSKESMSEINKWFKENVHQYAGTYALNTVWEKRTGSKLNPEPWFNYIKGKYEIA